MCSVVDSAHSHSPIHESLEASYMTKKIHGSESFFLSTADVSVAVTQQGGHMAPVTFHTSEGDFSPYSSAPWEPKECDESLPHLLKELRGDFFCLPFGPQENGLPHGDTANSVWQQLYCSANEISLVCHSQCPEALVKKTISLRTGHTALYISHQIDGLHGDFSYGNHPILDFSGLTIGEGRLAVSPFRWASVYPGVFSNPDHGETGILQHNALFSSLCDVPTHAGGSIDLTKYPTQYGHEDLIMMVNEPATSQQPFAWSAVTMKNMVWFSLKLVEDFPATLFWISNGGRSAHPWESRHTCRLGIEEVCSYFCDSVDQSRLHLLSHLAIPTTRKFTSDKSTDLRIIQGATPVPSQFGQVKQIVPSAEGVLITGENGHSIAVSLDLAFLLANQKPQ